MSFTSSFKHKPTDEHSPEASVSLVYQACDVLSELSEEMEHKYDSDGQSKVFVCPSPLANTLAVPETNILRCIAVEKYPAMRRRNQFALSAYDRSMELYGTKGPRNQWDPIRRSQQKLYDTYRCQHRVVNRLWRIATKIRQELSSQGINQVALGKHRGALQVAGVIYAIYSLTCKKLYIGQTKQTCFRRFQSHVWEAKNCDSPLHKVMYKYGWKDFKIFPLEFIPPEKYNFGSELQQRDNFRAYASPRERFWWNLLHTYEPLGFNCLSAQRKRSRRCRKHNPLKYVRDRKLRDNSVGGLTNVPSLSSPLRNSSQLSVDEVMESVGGQEGRKRAAGASLALSGSRTYGYRDCMRRCTYLVNRVLQGSPVGHVQLDRYRPRNLWTMRWFLMHEQHKLDTCAVKQLLSVFEGYLYLRNKPVNKEGPKGSNIFRLHWQSRCLTDLKLRRTMTKPEIHQLLPEQAKPEMDNMLIVNTLVEPIHRIIFNFTKVARDLSPTLVATSECGCGALFAQQYEGHVFTGDLSIIKCTPVSNLLKFGPRFRTYTPAKPLDMLRRALEQYSKDLSNKLSIDPSQFVAWRETVFEACKNTLSALPISTRKQGLMITQQIRKYLKYIHHHLVLLPIDKAANNVACICKACYVSVLRQELTREGGAYELVVDGVSEEDIRENIANQLKPFKLNSGSNRLAYLYWLPKMHKSPPSQRFIAGSADCPTTKCSKVLSDILSYVGVTIRDKDDMRILTSGVRHYFVVNDYAQVSSFLLNWSHKHVTKEERQEGLKPSHLYTGDFSTMYTTIPHGDLVEKVGLVVDEAWEHMGVDLDVSVDDIWLKYKDGESEWVVRPNLKRSVHTAREHVFSRQGLKDLIQILVASTYLVNGQLISHQVLGIPMGTNCAPILANLYLYWYESNFMSRLTAKDQALAQSFHMTFRLIDDVLSVDNAEFIKYATMSHEEGGIYPAALLLNNTSLDSSTVVFLGMKLSLGEADGRLNITVFDKRLEFPFSIVRYPNMESLIPSSIPYGVFVGQLYRYYRICTRWQDFIDWSITLAKTLYTQGCSCTRLKRLFHNFLSRFKFLRWRIALARLSTTFNSRLGN
jgi:hypothetical protein